MLFPLHGGASQSELLRSPVWDAVLVQVGAGLSDRVTFDRTHWDAGAAYDDASRTLATARARLLATLHDGGKLGQDAVSDLVTDAITLLRAIAQVWAARQVTTEDRAVTLVDALRRRLSAHEYDVLAGELTYAVTVAETERPAARMRASLANLAAGDGSTNEELFRLQLAAIDLVALLVRAAGNLATAGHAGDAPEPRTTSVERVLRAIEQEVRACAVDLGRVAADRTDLTGHFLTTALRAPVPAVALQPLPSSPDSSQVHDDVLAGVRDAWLRIAALEYAAVLGLDADVAEPTYRSRFGTLGAAIVAGGANILCGARLLTRAEAFPHGRAWGSQGIALSYALETYVDALRGVADGFDRAQLIVLTRLVRATVAIALIDLRHAAVSADPRERLPVR